MTGILRPKPQLLAMLAGGSPDGVDHNGDLGALRRLLNVLTNLIGLLDEPDPTFAIVTPRLEMSMPGRRRASTVVPSTWTSLHHAG
jgi:hypothetical protein